MDKSLENCEKNPNAETWITRHLALATNISFQFVGLIRFITCKCTPLPKAGWIGVQKAVCPGGRIKLGSAGKTKFYVKGERAKIVVLTIFLILGPCILATRVPCPSYTGTHRKRRHWMDTWFVGFLTHLLHLHPRECNMTVKTQGWIYTRKSVSFPCFLPWKRARDKNAYERKTGNKIEIVEKFLFSSSYCNIFSIHEAGFQLL